MQIVLRWNKTVHKAFSVSTNAKTHKNKLHIGHFLLAVSRKIVELQIVPFFMREGTTELLPPPFTFLW